MDPRPIRQDFKTYCGPFHSISQTHMLLHFNLKDISTHINSFPLMDQPPNLKICLCVLFGSRIHSSICNFVCVCVCVCFLGLHLWHMEVPKLEVKLELQLPAYTTATATPVTYTIAQSSTRSLIH